MASLELILIRGLPGSGKSTFAKLLDFPIIEADQYFYDDIKGKYTFDASKLSEAHVWCQDRVSTYLNGGFSVVVSNTSTTEKEVKVYQDIAERYNAEFVSLIVENRHGNKSIHDVPDNVMENMKKRFSVKL